VHVEVDGGTAATVYVDPAGADCRVRDGEAVVHAGRHRVPIAVPFVPVTVDRTGGAGLAVFNLHGRGRANADADADTDTSASMDVVDGDADRTATDDA
jgi:hypothetical protein